MEYSGPSVVLHFKIGNVSCSGCTNNIEKKVSEEYGEQGLMKVSANSITKKMAVEITYEAKGSIQPEKIEELLREMGKEWEFLEEEVKGSPRTGNRNSFKKILRGENGKLSTGLGQW